MAESWIFSRKNIIITLYVVIQSAYLLTEYNLTGGKFGVPLDDTWIHFRYAENFAHGHIFQYNSGEPTPGTTAPFWVIILSIPFLFSQNLFMPFAILVSSLFFLFALLELYDLCIKLGIDNAHTMLITLITALCGRLMWSSLSGMEITFCVLVCILVFKNHIKEITQERLLVSSGLFLGLASVLRPEVYLLAFIYYIFTLILFRKKLRDNLTKLLLSFLVFSVIILPYPVFCYATTGSLLPNTYQGQVTEMNYLPNLKFLIETGKIFVKENLGIVILWFAAMFYFIMNLLKGKIDKKYILMNAWVILLPAISSVIAPNWRHHGRYLIPLIPFINIVSVILFQKICSYTAAKKKRGAGLVRQIGMLALLFFSINSCVVFAATLGWNVDNINNQQVKIGTWLKEKLPGEKAFALNDIGAIAFITKKYVVDMAGLVTPQVFRFQKLSYEEGAKELFKLLKLKGVNYIVIYPDWYEYIMLNYSNYFEQVYSAKLEKNTICGGIEMFVYKINWDKLNLDTK